VTSTRAMTARRDRACRHSRSRTQRHRTDVPVAAREQSSHQARPPPPPVKRTEEMTVRMSRVPRTELRVYGASRLLWRDEQSLIRSTLGDPKHDHGQHARVGHHCLVDAASRPCRCSERTSCLAATRWGGGSSELDIASGPDGKLNRERR
jgi:hypothetical protein